MPFYFLILVFLFKVTEAGIVIFKDEEKIEEFHDSELPFSRHEFRGIEGVIVSADPPDACSPIVSPPNVSNHINWFVLIAGNFCDYGTKVIYSELAGYSAAVIYSLRGGDFGFQKHHVYYSNITAVLIRTNSGLIIKDNYLYTINKRYRLFVYPNDTFDTISLLSMMVAAMAGLVVIVMISFMILKYVQRAHANQTARLNSQHLGQLQTARFRIGDPYETCAICLEDYRNNDKLRILPCCHGYHANCIDQWLTENRRICPICKKQVIFHGEFPEIDSHSNVDQRSEVTPLLSGLDQRSVPSSSYRALSNNAYQGRLHFIPIAVRQTISFNDNASVAAINERSISRNTVADRNVGSSTLSNAFSI